MSTIQRPTCSPLNSTNPDSPPDERVRWSRMYQVAFYVDVHHAYLWPDLITGRQRTLERQGRRPAMVW